MKKRTGTGNGIFERKWKLIIIILILIFSILVASGTAEIKDTASQESVGTNPEPKIIPVRVTESRENTDESAGTNLQLDSEAEDNVESLHAVQESPEPEETETGVDKDSKSYGKPEENWRERTETTPEVKSSDREKNNEGNYKPDLKDDNIINTPKILQSKQGQKINQKIGVADNEQNQKNIIQADTGDNSEEKQDFSHGILNQESPDKKDLEIKGDAYNQATVKDESEQKIEAKPEEERLKKNGLKQDKPEDDKLKQEYKKSTIYTKSTQDSQEVQTEGTETRKVIFTQENVEDKLKEKTRENRIMEKEEDSKNSLKKEDELAQKDELKEENKLKGENQKNEVENKVGQKTEEYIIKENQEIRKNYFEEIKTDHEENTKRNYESMNKNEEGKIEEIKPVNDQESMKNPDQEKENEKKAYTYEHIKENRDNNFKPENLLKQNQEDVKDQIKEEKEEVKESKSMDIKESNEENFEPERKENKLPDDLVDKKNNLNNQNNQDNRDKQEIEENNANTGQKQYFEEKINNKLIEHEPESSQTSVNKIIGDNSEQDIGENGISSGQEPERDKFEQIQDIDSYMGGQKDRGEELDKIEESQEIDKGLDRERSTESKLELKIISVNEAYSSETGEEGPEYKTAVKDGEESPKTPQEAESEVHFCNATKTEMCEKVCSAEERKTCEGRTPQIKTCNVTRLEEKGMRPGAKPEPITEVFNWTCNPVYNPQPQEPDPELIPETNPDENSWENINFILSYSYALDSFYTIHETVKVDYKGPQSLAQQKVDIYLVKKSGPYFSEETLMDDVDKGRINFGSLLNENTESYIQVPDQLNENGDLSPLVFGPLPAGDYWTIITVAGNKTEDPGEKEVLSADYFKVLELEMTAGVQGSVKEGEDFEVKLTPGDSSDTTLENCTYWAVLISEEVYRANRDGSSSEIKTGIETFLKNYVIEENSEINSTANLSTGSGNYGPGLSKAEFKGKIQKLIGEGNGAISIGEENENTLSLTSIDLSPGSYLLFAGAFEKNKGLVGIAQKKLTIYTPKTASVNKDENPSGYNSSEDELSIRASSLIPESSMLEAVKEVSIEELKPKIEGAVDRTTEIIRNPPKIPSFVLGFIATLLTGLSIIKIKRSN